MAENTVSRGRPSVVEKTTLEVGNEKITLTLVEDGRVQVSLPGSWVVSSLSSASGRKRLDVVPFNGTVAKVATPAKKTAPTKKAAAKKAAVKKATAPKAKASAQAEGSTPRRRRKAAASA